MHGFCSCAMQLKTENSLFMMMSMKNKTQQSVKRSVPTWKAIRKFTSSLSLSQMTFRIG
jgi:hypothetical protein